MALVALLSLSLVLFSFSTKNTTLTQAQCVPDQRHALIQLKQGFDTTQLHSWNASIDCCIWDVILCDEKTGMVTTLNLFDMGISGEINPALFNLSSLQYLNLAWNYFDNLKLPQTGFEQLSNLTHLDLSNSGFVGQVPVSICALTKLISLNLSITNTNTNTMYIHDTGLKTILSNLTELQVLCLDGIDISLNGYEWGKTVFHLTNLQKLSMSYCRLQGNFPYEIFHLTNLTELDLSLNLNWSAQLPDSIGNLQHLSILDLSNCKFYGEVPPSITNLTRLQHLNLGSNSLTGMIPMSLFSHPSLVSLLLPDNYFSGYLPEFSNGSSNLELFDLSNNNLQGKLPISIFKSLQLIRLNLESNNFNGTFNLDNIQHNRNLESLSLSNNNLSIIEGKAHKESFYSSFPQLMDIRMASCNLTKFPSFLSYRTNIVNLDLSDNNIDGDIPTLPNVHHLFLSHNNLMGEIPHFICNMTIPRVLDLSYNYLTGTIPPCLLEDAEFLEVLKLENNYLSGTLPQNFSQGCLLRTINLRENRINGSLPQSLLNCNNLELLDLANNQIVDRFPSWLGNLETLRALILRSNQFYGTISNMEDRNRNRQFLFPHTEGFRYFFKSFQRHYPQKIV